MAMCTAQVAGGSSISLREGRIALIAVHQHEGIERIADANFSENQETIQQEHAVARRQLTAKSGNSASRGGGGTLCAVQDIPPGVCCMRECILC